MGATHHFPRKGKSALRLPSRPNSHSERQRRILVRGAVEPNAIKYRSAGSSRLRRPNFGPILRDPPSSIPVGQSKGKPFYGQVKGQLCPTWQSYAGLPPVEGAYVTGLASCPSGHSGRSEESWYAAHMRQWALNTGRWEGCRLAARSALRIISTCHVVHPLPLRGIPPMGSMSLDFQVASLPYKSSSFATSRGHKTLRDISHPTGHSERSEESWYAAHMRQWALNTSWQEAAAFSGSPYPASRDFSTGKRLT